MSEQPPPRYTGHRHPLVALSNLAAKERWCWNLACTTCGHMHFRFALQHIGRGQHPDSAAWTIHRDRGVPDSPAPRSPFPDQEQLALVTLLSTVQVSELAASAPFPDWLGYLGLFLRYSDDAERSAGTATRNLVPQLRALVEAGSPAAAHLTRLGVDNNDRLRWNDLGVIEGNLLG